MSESAALLLPVAVGGGLGAFFFGGLSWTVARGIASPQPGLWFALSLLVRTTVVLAGFLMVAGAGWDRLLAAVFGLTIARIVVMRITRPAHLGCVPAGARVASGYAP